MFSNSIQNLPSCSNYQGALRIWERAKVPPRSKNWSFDERPLGTVSKTHYAVIKDGAKIVFRLHQTNVVEWHNENSFTLDSCYDSISTRAFAERFLPGGIGFVSMKENGYVVAQGEKRFLRGRHKFEGSPYLGWVCVSQMIKPKRTVGIKSKMREVQAQTKDTTSWVKGLWAISGSEGEHPWLGKPREITRLDFRIEELADPECREAFVLSLLPEVWTRNSVTRGHHRVYARFNAKQLVTKINEYFYQRMDCYTRIDYDAPIPRD